MDLGAAAFWLVVMGISLGAIVYLMRNRR